MNTFGVAGITTRSACIPRIRVRRSREKPPMTEVTTIITMIPMATPAMEK